jgi:hypothetical protein
MSGICSAHQGHDPNCPRCTATPLTEEDKHFYAGMEFAYEAMKNNCWTPVENYVLNIYAQLEDVARRLAGSETHPEMEKVLDKIDAIRKIGRKTWDRDLET